MIRLRFWWISCNFVPVWSTINQHCATPRMFLNWYWRQCQRSDEDLKMQNTCLWWSSSWFKLSFNSVSVGKLWGDCWISSQEADISVYIIILVTWMPGREGCGLGYGECNSGQSPVDAGHGRVHERVWSGALAPCSRAGEWQRVNVDVHWFWCQHHQA